MMFSKKTYDTDGWEREILLLERELGKKVFFFRINYTNSIRTIKGENSVFIFNEPALLSDLSFLDNKKDFSMLILLNYDFQNGTYTYIYRSHEVIALKMINNGFYPYTVNNVNPNHVFAFSKSANVRIEESYERYIMNMMELFSEAEDKSKKLEKQCMNYQQKNAALEIEIQKINHSISMRITKPLRIILKPLKNIKIINHLYTKIFQLLKNGPKRALKKFLYKLYEKKTLISLITPLNEQLSIEKEKKFLKEPKISILVPLYNTNKVFLKDMLESVVSQTYENWELCIADASDDSHSYVFDICLQFMENRMIYKKLEENKGIVGNTNFAFNFCTGEYVTLLDHDDILHPSALYKIVKQINESDTDFIYTDEVTFADNLKKPYNPNFKPDFSPDTLRSYNYICHLICFDKNLIYGNENLLNQEYEGSQDYDLILRLSERAKKIVHIPELLYFWRAHKSSVALSIDAKPYTVISAKKALQDHLNRIHLEGNITDAVIPSTYRIKYTLIDLPLVSIIIPNKDSVRDLKKCINSIINKSTYENYEIIVIENNSISEEIFQYYEELKKQNILVYEWKDKFNYAAINNYAATFAKGEYLLFLNNDVEVISNDWIEEMLQYNQRKDVGVVGCRLLYPDDTIQHNGVILGVGGIAGHAFKRFKRSDSGFMSRIQIVQNLSAVTAACMMMKKTVFDAVNGFNEEYEVAFNDVDICMKVRNLGYLIIMTPFAELYHYESLSRGNEDTPDKIARFNREIETFKKNWGNYLEQGDPYYNRNLTLKSEDFAIKRREKE